MNISTAFLIGTKIKDIDVPDEPWTKITTIPVEENPDPTNYPTMMKSVGVYNGEMYEVDGNYIYGNASSTFPTFTVKRFNGTSWSTVRIINTPSYDYDWSFLPGGTIFVNYVGKLWIFNKMQYRYSIGSGKQFCYTFDGSSWQSVAPENGWPLIAQAVVVGDKLRLFAIASAGAWNVTYWYEVYEYDASTNELTHIGTNVLRGNANNASGNYQAGYSQIVLYNNKLHCIGTTSDYYSGTGWVHVVDPTTWQIESSTRPSGTTIELCVSRGKLHAFNDQFGHYIYNAVSDTWDTVQSASYQPNPNVGANRPIKAVTYKKRLHTIGVCNMNAQSYPEDTSYDEVYRYNK